jgi:CDP-diacylglycerol---serine O-phosphatidyltransferase
LIDVKRFFRYLAPNLVTFASLTFGMCSIVASLEGRWADAAWFVVYSVLTDKLDGFVARLVKGTSEFGVQLDSFADFLNFGIAPATLWYAYLGRPEISGGAGRALMMGAMGVWVLAVTFRLARYNIVGDDPRCKRIFFGVPTTLMGGLLCALFLTALKYGADPTGVSITVNDEPMLLGGLQIPGVIWDLWPVLVTVGALLMASTIKIPKLGLSRSRVATVFIGVNVLLGYGAGASRHFPEYMTFAATMWILGSLVWGRFNRETRRLHPPPICPRNELPASKMPVRPEEDMLPEDDDGSAVDSSSVISHSTSNPPIR